MAIEALNASQIQEAIAREGASWQAGPTSVSELPTSEKELRLGYEPGPGEPSLQEREQLATANLSAYGAVRAVGAPASYDLRNVGGANYITPIKDQGGCGSCVSFGTLATVEGTFRRQRGDPNLAIDLSEAQLFNCIARSQGRNCSNGWWVDPALNGCRDNGVADEACYPYTAGDQNCTNLCSDWQNR